MRLATIYSDRTLFIWDVRNLTVYRSFLHHSMAINDLTSFNGQNMMVTGSHDKTIKIWHLADTPPTNRNAYSKDLLKLIYVDLSSIDVFKS
mmetsp:Transcript_24516/g.11734  ORF Transcript_24516/g.11734 Transcript_24516/m.11734 type:complete len:91 (-) Transcript_24516:78-350(-)